jgi:hypothetical protein
MINLPLVIYYQITISEKRTGWLHHVQFHAGSETIVFSITSKLSLESTCPVSAVGIFP